jgi:hypothetical protein
MLVKIGDRVRDTVTGYVGWVDQIWETRTDNARAIKLDPRKLMPDGTLMKQEWFPEDRLEEAADPKPKVV